jgi:hypothetical protein
MHLLSVSQGQELINSSLVTLHSNHGFMQVSGSIERHRRRDFLTHAENCIYIGTDRRRFSRPQHVLANRARSIGVTADGTESQFWSAPLCQNVLILSMYDEG